jgi:hypothetical protein
MLNVLIVFVTFAGPNMQLVSFILPVLLFILFPQTIRLMNVLAATSRVVILR